MKCGHAWGSWAGWVRGVSFARAEKPVLALAVTGALWLGVGIHVEGLGAGRGCLWARRGRNPLGCVS